MAKDYKAIFIYSRRSCTDLIYAGRLAGFGGSFIRVWDLYSSNFLIIGSSKTKFTFM